MEKMTYLYQGFTNEDPMGILYPKGIHDRIKAELQEEEVSKSDFEFMTKLKKIPNGYLCGVIDSDKAVSLALDLFNLTTIYTYSEAVELGRNDKIVEYVTLSAPSSYIKKIHNMEGTMFVNDSRYGMYIKEGTFIPSGSNVWVMPVSVYINLIESMMKD